MMWSTVRGPRIAQIVALALTALSQIPAPSRAQDTHIRLDSGPGAYPPNIHVDVAPGAALTVSAVPPPRSIQASLNGYGGWGFTFRAPLTLPIGVGTYDPAGTGAGTTAFIQVTYNQAYTTVPYGSFEVRQLRRNAQGKITALWLLFQHRTAPAAAPLSGEIRWNADTSLYLRCPNLLTFATGDSATFDVSGVDTRGRPVILSATGLPSGASFSTTGPGISRFRWPTTPGVEGIYPVHFSVANDQGLTDTSTTYLRISRPMSVFMRGDPADPVTHGAWVVADTRALTLQAGAYPTDSTLSGESTTGYHTWDWVFRPPAHNGLTPGTYRICALAGTQAPNETAIAFSYDGIGCSSLGATELRVREYRVGPDSKVISFWAELQQSCAGAAGGLLADLRFNCDTTLDVQAPAVLLSGQGETVAFDVQSRTIDGYPAQLQALAIPPGATFADRGNGTGAFQWVNSAAPGQVALASFVAVAHGGRRDTVTSRIRSSVPYRVSLSAMPGDYFWPNNLLAFEPSTGTLTFSEGADSSLTASVQGQSRTWTFTLSAPGTRRLTTGLYDSTVPDRYRISSRARVRVNRDDRYTVCTDDARFQVRKLSRASDGTIRSLWATFTLACGSGGPQESGEIRYGVDTTLYLTVPGEISAPLGTPVHSEISATEAHGRPVHFELLSAPAGALLTDRANGTAAVDWSAGPSIPGLVAFTVAATSDGGVRDTATYVVRGYAPASLDIASEPEDPVGLGVTEHTDASDAIHELRRDATGRVIASVATPDDLWSLTLQGPSQTPIAPGVYPDAILCNGCSSTSPGLDLFEDGRYCETGVAGEFDVRRLRFAPDGSIRSAWLRFAQTCSGAGGLSGDLRYAADTSNYLRVPASFDVEVGRPISVQASAVDTRGLSLALTGLNLPAGAIVVDRGDGTATLDWPEGAPVPGSYPITWVATSSDGAADTASTTIQAFRVALFAIQSSPDEPIGAGQNLRLTGADGAVTTAVQGDGSFRISSSGASHTVECFFQSSFGAALREGVFDGARLYGTTEWNRPALQMAVDGRICSMDSASFHIRQLRRSATGAVTTFWATFQQRCAGSSGFLAGEIRLSPDTSLYVEAPAEIARHPGDAVSFTVRAVDTRGRPVSLAALELPPGATLASTGPGTGAVSWAATDSAGSVTRISIVAQSDDGAKDTVTTLVRTFSRDFMHLVSATGDYIGQGLTYDLDAMAGALDAKQSPGILQANWGGRFSSWSATFSIPYGRTPSVGRYNDPAAPYAFVTRGAVDVGTTGRACGGVSHQAFQIRRIELGPSNTVKRLWATFASSCTSGPGISGEVVIGGDTLFYVEAPADLYPDDGQTVGFSFHARGALATDVHWSLLTAPAGGSLAGAAGDSVTFAWAGTTLPGDYPVTVRASGAAGSDSMTTWIHVPSPSFIAIKSGPSYLNKAGLDRRFTDRDGVLRIWHNDGNGISNRLDGIAVPYSFEIDLSRAGGLGIAPGDYFVTGPIPPYGNSPNGFWLVWNSLVPTLTTGSYHVNSVTMDHGTLTSFWATFQMHMANTSATFAGEIYLAGMGAPTPALASLIDCDWTGSAVRLLWHVPDESSELVVERQKTPGEWESIGKRIPSDDGLVEWLDADVERGHRYGYRLVAPADSSVIATEGWIDVPARATLAIERLGPNPGGMPLQFALSLPERGWANIDLLDVAGRVLEHRRWEELPEGRQLVTIDRAGSLTPGCYFVRLSAASGVRSRSIVVLR